MATVTRKAWKRRSDARPAELRVAALRLFALQGYGGTTIEEIAAAGDVTVGTIYRYFRDKEALLHEIVAWASTEPFLPMARSAPSSNRLRDLAEAIWTASRKEPHVHVIRLLIAESGNVPALVDRYRTEVLEPVERALARELEPTTGGEPLVAARALLGALLGASVLAGPPSARAPIVPQLAPIDTTVAALLKGFDRGEPPPPAAPAPPPKSTSRPRAPDSW